LSVQKFEVWQKWSGNETNCVDLSCSPDFYLFIIIICTLLLVRSRHFLASSLKFMATIEVSHKAAGVRSS